MSRAMCVAFLSFACLTHTGCGKDTAAPAPIVADRRDLDAEHRDAPAPSEAPEESVPCDSPPEGEAGAELIAEEHLGRQLAEPLERDDPDPPVTVVVSPGPVFGVRLVEDLQRLAVSRFVRHAPVFKALSTASSLFGIVLSPMEPIGKTICAMKLQINTARPPITPGNKTFFMVSPR